MMQPTKQQLTSHPSIRDLHDRAKKRLPLIAWEYLDMGTGDEKAVDRNRERLDEITFRPRFMQGLQTQDLTTTLFGRTYQTPFGVAPVGLTGLIWPEAEKILAQTAAQYQFPYTLSTVATQTPETIGPLVGEMGWFQLYPPRDPEVRADILKRASESGFHTMVVTADVPAPSRRERTARAGLTMPPKVTPYFVWQAALHPAWTAATLGNGLPRLRTVEKYAGEGGIGKAVSFVGQQLGGTLSWEYMQALRDLWPGTLILKGLLHPADAEQALAVGVDGITVSNHGGRQFDGAPAAINALPAIVEVVNGRVPVLIDSGIRTGLDIIRALALGADYVFLGRAFMYGVAAFGQSGGAHAAEILIGEMKANMGQLGVTTVEGIKGLSPDDS